MAMSVREWEANEQDIVPEATGSEIGVAAEGRACWELSEELGDAGL
jgi:hypothetical protein